MEKGKTFKLRDGETVQVIGSATLKISDSLTGGKITLSTYDIEELYNFVFPDRIKEQS